MNHIILLCHASGVLTREFEAAGCRVTAVDTKTGGDVRDFYHVGQVDGVVAEFPCTQFAGSGARWWASKPPELLTEAKAIADACCRIVLMHKPRFWWFENPVGRLPRWYGAPVMTFNPCEFAGWADDPASEGYTKRSCLWGEFARPEKRPVPPLLGSKMHLLPPTPDRADLRSRTPQGFARAMVAANVPASADLYAESGATR